MRRRNKYILGLALLFAGVAGTAKGQSYVKDFLTHQVVVNRPGRNIVAEVKPVRQVALETDKWYYWYAHNQVSSTQGGFSGKLLNGRYREFYENKQPRESGQLDKGLKSGLWKNWTENGILRQDYTWKSGRLNGVYHKYDSAGKVLESGRYRNDLLQGKQKNYTASGVKEVLYRKGKVTERKKLRLPGFIRKIFPKKPKTM